MTEMRTLRRAARPTQAFSCGYVGCSGCYMCTHAAPASPLGNTNLTRSPDVITTDAPEVPDESPSRNPWLTPGKSYAEAVTGSPCTPSPAGSLSTGITRGHESEYVTPDNRVSSDTLSSPMRNDANENIIIGNTTIRNQQPSRNPPGPISNNTTRRYKWTREEKVELFWCYCYARAKQLPITNGTYEVWRQ